MRFARQLYDLAANRCAGDHSALGRKPFAGLLERDADPVGHPAEEPVGETRNRIGFVNHRAQPQRARRQQGTRAGVTAEADRKLDPFSFQDRPRANETGAEIRERSRLSGDSLTHHR